MLDEHMLSSAWALVFRRWTVEAHQNRGSKAIVLITMYQSVDDEHRIRQAIDPRVEMTVDDRA